MAEKNSPSILNIIYLLFWAILPCIYVSGTIIDNTLLPRQLFVGIALLLILILGWKQISAKNQSLKVSELAYIGFFIFSAISSFFAVNTIESLAILGKYGMVLSFLILTATLLRRGALTKEILVKGIVLFGLVSSGITLFQLFGSLSAGNLMEDIYAIKGSFSHKNLLSSALMLTLPFALIGRVILNERWKKISTLVLFLLVLEIFVLRTRGVWLSIFLSGGITFLTYWLLSKGKKDLITIPLRLLGIISGVAIALMLIAVFNSSEKNQIDDQSSFQSRLVFWENSTDMIKENPLTGVGAGNWRIHFPKHGLNKVDLNVMQGITHIQRPHNDYLWVAAEGGIITVLFYIALFVLTLIQIRKNLMKSESAQDLVVNLCLLFGVALYMAFSFVDFPMERLSHSLLIISMIALAFQKSDGFSVKFNFKPIPVILLVLTLFGLHNGYHRFQGEKGAKKVLRENKRRNAQKIIPAVENAENAYYVMDNFSNPLRYYSSLGQLVLKQPEEAWKDLQLAKDYHPYNILVLNQMGNVLKTQNQTDEALEYYEKALRIAPRFEQALLNKAEVYIQRKDAASAMKALYKVRHNSSNPKYVDFMKSMLPVLVSEKAKHGLYKSMIEYIVQQNPQNREQYFNAYKRFKKDKILKG